MGLLDFIFGGDDAQFKRHARRMVNLNAQGEDRDASAIWLADNGSPEAISALLNRFTIKYEQGMKDAAEKETIYRILVDIGPSVVDPVRDWARVNQQFAQPIRLIEHFEGPEAAVSLLLEMLAVEKDPFKPEKKRQILIHLADFRDHRIIEGAQRCVTDFDEGVRYAAGGAILAQEPDVETTPILQTVLRKILADPEEDSNRLKVLIAEAFHQRRWALGDATAAVAEYPPHGWVVSGDRLVPA
ncbi:MAG: hypothetical protein GXP62_15685 [Oligoflexia bacterium]|nr:hypothetical protein [Oligoflexia bacterium]